MVVDLNLALQGTMIETKRAEGEFAPWISAVISYRGKLSCAQPDIMEE